MNKFEVGDKVSLVVDNPDGNPDLVKGDTGIIRNIDGPLQVEWDKDIEGHNLDNLLNNRNGWNVDETEVEPFRITNWKKQVCLK